MNHCHPRFLASAALLAATTFAGSLAAANNYLVHNLVSDLAGIADHQDKNLVNPWGNAFSATSPFWVGDNGTGLSTLYDGTGTAISLVVTIPAAGGATTTAPVTGVMLNTNTSAFNVAAGKAASFMFCSEDGVISGWNSSVQATKAIILADNSKNGAVYKGCVLGGTSTAPLLFAANFNSGKIDVWDGTMTAVQNGASAFVDPSVPSAFAPFNIQNIGGKLYVTYARQDAAKMDDVAGVGNGYVAVYDFSGNLLSNLVSNGPLNSPWGMAVAPASFGDFAGALLVGNFGDGMIHAFDINTGALKGALDDVKGNPIAVPGMWSLNFGNGGRGGDPATLYFTAGIGGGPNNDPVESHGLLGSIQPAPSFQTTGIVNSASFSSTISANSWVTIKGGALAATTRPWATKDFTGNNLPTALDGVTVSVNGQPVPISYISPTQINFLMPPDIAAGPVQIQTANNGLTSSSATATVSATAPAFFSIGTNATTKNVYIAATHADNSLIGPPSLITGVTTTPAKEGETIVLYGNGMGPTTPQATSGQTVTTALPLATLPNVTIGGVPAQVAFAGLVGPGLYQLNVVVPNGLTPGTTANIDVPVVVSTGGGAQSPSNAVITVVNPTT